MQMLLWRYILMCYSKVLSLIFTYTVHLLHISFFYVGKTPCLDKIWWYDDV